MNQLWGPAMEAELEYRRERAAQAYGTPPWWTRVRTRSTARSTARSGARSTAPSAARSAARSADSSADRAPAGAGRWEESIARRAAQIGEGLEALRLHHGTGRRAA